MHFFSDFNSLFHSFEMSLKGISPISPSDAMLFRENEASENPDFSWGDATIWPTANFRVDMREGDHLIWILY